MLKKLQATSGIVFFGFVVVHLINTWLAAFGADAYNTTQQALRTVYQAAPIEALLLAALAVHLTVGIMRIVTEPKRQLSDRAKWHRYAGFFLAVVITGHIAAVRGPSWFLDIYPEFQGLAFSLDILPGYFYPYYFLLGLAGFYHALKGVGIALSRLGMPLRISRSQLRSTTIAAALLTMTALLGLTGIWTDLGDIYSSDFAQLALELTGETDN